MSPNNMFVYHHGNDCLKIEKNLMEWMRKDFGDDSAIRHGHLLESLHIPLGPSQTVSRIRILGETIPEVNRKFPMAANPMPSGSRRSSKNRYGKDWDSNPDYVIMPRVAGLRNTAMDLSGKASPRGETRMSVWQIRCDGGGTGWR